MNWRTTIGGIILAVGVVCGSLPWDWCGMVAQALQAAGAVVLGLSAADAKNSRTK